MAKQLSRVQKTTGKRVAQKRDELLLATLNAQQKVSDEGMRVVGTKRKPPLLLLRFVEAFQALGVAHETYAAHPSTAARDTRAKALKEVNAILSVFRLTPVMLPEPAPKGMPWDLTWFQENASEAIPADYPWIHQVFSMFREGRFNALKRCEKCGNWLAARFSHQRFCSARCKEDFHRSDPGDKKRRREWARNNYQIHKTKNIK